MTNIRRTPAIWSHAGFFRRLRVWVRAHTFVLAVRRAARAFPRPGYSDLKTQIVRAADSIPSNIVEGCGAATKKEFARYLDISIKMLYGLRRALLADSGNAPDVDRA